MSRQFLVSRLLHAVGATATASSRSSSPAAVAHTAALPSPLPSPSASFSITLPNAGGPTLRAASQLSWLHSAAKTTTTTTTTTTTSSTSSTAAVALSRLAAIGRHVAPARYGLFGLFSTATGAAAAAAATDGHATLRLRVSVAAQGKKYREMIAVEGDAEPSQRERAHCGEDAFFVAETPAVCAIGVADGVGGWADVGVDPSEFSWALMNNAKDVVRQSKEPESSSLAPKSLLIEAYRRVVSAAKVRAGSSTACVLTLAKNSGRLEAANLGDSGYMIVRDGKIAVRSKEQQHDFNFPYQLGVGGPSDSPRDAETFSHQVQEGDLVIVGTDGLFDNVYDGEMLDAINEKQHNALETAIAKALVRRAVVFASITTRISPFAAAASKYGYTNVVGGKPDDITVIVARVVAVDNTEASHKQAQSQQPPAS